MKPEYWREYEDQMERMRVGSRDWNEIAVRMMNSCAKNVQDNLELNPETDPPAPDWVMKIIKGKMITKRMKISLIDFHNKKIREYRMKQAKGV